jgi:hypothetical protein
VLAAFADARITKVDAKARVPSCAIAHPHVENEVAISAGIIGRPRAVVTSSANKLGNQRDASG